MTDDLGTCTMCEQEPATRIFFAPVCDDCHDGLEATGAALAEAEANDPELAELGRKLLRSYARAKAGA